jgi:hypothetical protein
MPQGKGTYGSQVGRPPKKKKPGDFSKGGRVAKAEGGSLLNNDIQRYQFVGGGFARLLTKKLRSLISHRDRLSKELNTEQIGKKKQKEISKEINELDKEIEELKKPKTAIVDEEGEIWSPDELSDEAFDEYADEAIKARGKGATTSYKPTKPLNTLLGRTEEIAVRPSTKAGYVVITRESPFTGEVNTMELKATVEQFERYDAGEGLIQEIFPDLTPDEREFIMTGITAKEWDKFVPDEYASGGRVSRAKGGRVGYADGDEVDEEEFEPWELWDYATSLFKPRETAKAVLHKVKEHRKANPNVQRRTGDRQKAQEKRKKERAASILGQHRERKSKIRTAKSTARETARAKKSTIIAEGGTKKEGRQAKRATNKAARKKARTSRQSSRGVSATLRRLRREERRKARKARRAARKKTFSGGRISKQMGELVGEGTRAMTQEERKQSLLKELLKSINVQVDREDNEYPQKEIDRAYKALVKNSKTVGFSQNEIDSYLQAERERRADERREAAEVANPLGARTDRMPKQEGGLPLIDDQMEELGMLPDEQIENQMLPDEEMEEDYVDFVVSSTLDEEQKNYLESALTEDAKLSEIFDQVIESASEFSGSGPVEGLGSEISDSIPARLSDGEFVFTAKAVDEIGADVLQQQMEAAEAGADQRQGVAYGGALDEDKKADIAVSTQGSILAAGGVPPVVPIDPIREEQLLSMQSSSPRRGYRTISG